MIEKEICPGVGWGGKGEGKQSKKENKTRRDKEENRFKRKNEGQ